MLFIKHIFINYKHLRLSINTSNTYLKHEKYGGNISI